MTSKQQVYSGGEGWGVGVGGEGWGWGMGVGGEFNRHGSRLSYTR